MSGSLAAPPKSTPMRRIRSGCCAWAASGIAAALLTNAMNSRRRMEPHSRHGACLFACPHTTLRCSVKSAKSALGQKRTSRH